MATFKVTYDKGASDWVTIQAEEVVLAERDWYHFVDAAGTIKAWVKAYDVRSIERLTPGPGE